MTKWILVILNAVVLVGLFVAQPTVRQADLAVTQSVIADLEKNNVLDPEALTEYIRIDNSGPNRTPERRLAVMLHYGRGMRLLLISPPLFLLLVNTICIAAFWKSKKDKSSNKPGGR